MDSKEDDDFIPNDEAKSDLYKSKDAKNTLTNEELVNNLKEYVLGDNFATRCENLIKAQSKKLSTKNGEYSLEHTKYFEEYKDFVDSNIESYLINELHCTKEEAYNALKYIYEVNNKDHPDSLWFDHADKWFVDLLLALSDFNMYVSIIQDMKNAMEDSDGESSDNDDKCQDSKGEAKDSK